jgi:hypothetical protein
VDAVRYGQRNVVERCIARHSSTGHCHRYDKLAGSYHSWLGLAALLIWLPTRAADTGSLEPYRLGSPNFDSSDKSLVRATEKAHASSTTTPGVSARLDAGEGGTWPTFLAG